MDFVTELPLVDSKNILFVCIDKFSKYCSLTPTFIGDSELSADQVDSLFFSSSVRFFRVTFSVLHDIYMHFTV